MRFALILCGSLLFVSVAEAAEHPVVPGFARFYSSGEADAARGGALLLGELNCASCHRLEGELAEIVATKQAPILDHVGDRARADYLRAFIANPQAVKPGTTMPNLFGAKPAEQREREVEALVHFLMSDRRGQYQPEAVRAGARAQGEALYHAVGCVACHGARKEGAATLATSMPLGDLDAKYTLAGLTGFLQDPLHVRPSGRMPDLNLSAPEAEAIAAYLLPGVPESQGLRYAYYEGSWNNLPDFDKLKPKKTGNVEEIGVAVAPRTDHFALRFEGTLQVPADGEYKFHLGSDDGSRLVIDGKTVLDANGIHPVTWKNATVALKRGRHAFAVEYFEQAGGQELHVEVEGPGLEGGPLARLLAPEKPRAEATAKAFVLNPQLVEQGRELFATQGCANCHARHENGQTIPARLAARPLRSLRAENGCLQDEPASGLPAYHLSDMQQRALAAAIEQGQGEVEQLTDAERIDLTLTRFNCYACHRRGEKGGVERARNAFFTGTQQEMGDEGRIPPHLTGVGGKLTRKWLDKILAEGIEARPYMDTRMPKFGAKNVGHLGDLLERTDALEPLADVPLDAIEARNAGRRMVGSKGFSCISCHTFGKYRATGVQSIDLTIMRDRLREEWFRRYVRDPQAFRRGTRMPQAWPKEKSLLPTILDGRSETQIAAIWDYLSAGERAKLPEGLVVGGMLQIPRDEAIIYRNFIEGAGPRAIAVGYPEWVHTAFDAENMRLALLWRGEFIDARRHWNGRGEGFEPPAGTHVLKLPQQPAFARLDSLSAPWPTAPAKEQGYSFRGYRLTDGQRPTFLYALGDNVRIADFPNPVERPAATMLLRTLTVEAERPVKNLYYRAAVGAKIEPQEGGWYQIGDAYRVRLESSGQAKPLVRRVGDRDELLLPVALDGQQVKITQEYHW